MAKKTKQVEKEGYGDGYHTGYTTGYKKGIDDALLVITNILTDNNIHMDPKEFFIEMDLLKEEGVLRDEYSN